MALGQRGPFAQCVWPTVLLVVVGCMVLAAMATPPLRASPAHSEAVSKLGRQSLLALASHKERRDDPYEEMAKGPQEDEEHFVYPGGSPPSLDLQVPGHVVPDRAQTAINNYNKVVDGNVAGVPEMYGMPDKAFPGMLLPNSFQYNTESEPPGPSPAFENFKTIIMASENLYYDNWPGHANTFIDVHSKGMPPVAVRHGRPFDLTKWGHVKITVSGKVTCEPDKECPPEGDRTQIILGLPSHSVIGVYSTDPNKIITIPGYNPFWIGAGGHELKYPGSENDLKRHGSSCKSEHSNLHTMTGGFNNHVDDVLNWNGEDKKCHDGSSHDATEPRQLFLFLAFNDDVFTDNSGAFSANIQAWGQRELSYGHLLPEDTVGS